MYSGPGGPTAMPGPAGPVPGLRAGAVERRACFGGGLDRGRPVSRGGTGNRPAGVFDHRHGRPAFLPPLSGALMVTALHACPITEPHVKTMAEGH